MKVSFPFIFLSLLFIGTPLLSIVIEPESAYFSPDFNGIHDTLKIKIKPEKKDKKGKISDWQLTIKNKGNQTVRSWKADVRKMRKGFSLFYLFSADNHFAQPQIKLPKYLEWDGNNDLGEKLPDGEYTCEFTYKDTNSIEYASEKIIAVMDSISPMAELSLQTRLITPDGDHKNDIIKITQKTKSEAGDSWTGEVISSSGAIVKSWKWTGRNIPYSLNWDGKDSFDNVLADGIYTYNLIGKDNAGNSVVSTVKISLLAQTNAVDAFPEKEIFSPDGDGIDDTIRFRIYLQGKTVVNSWKLQIFHGKKEKREIIKEFSGNQSLPSTIEWEGRNEKNIYLKDGIYNYQLIVYHTSGELRSNIDSIQTLTEKVKLTFSLNNKIFTPDGDGLHDLLVISPRIQGPKLKEWRLVIHEKYGPERRFSMPVKEWQGSGNLAGKIVWNGVKANGSLSGSKSNYELELEYTDEIGRTGHKIVNHFSTGIMVVPEKNNQFRISLTENEISQNKSVLKEARKLLRRYPGFTIELQSHTSQIGEDEKNLQKSEIRAKEVFYYLYKKKKPFGRYLFRGCGELEPFVSSEDVYSLNKNNRIDFLLFEKE